ncbi:ATP-binding protein [Lacunimicrobium album]
MPTVHPANSKKGKTDFMQIVSKQSKMYTCTTRMYPPTRHSQKSEVSLEKTGVHLSKKCKGSRMPMQTDVAGRVRNVMLPASKPLLPLYEAIVNSIQAIEDVGHSYGLIEIVVLRDKSNLFAESEKDRSLGAIIGFEVIDNGIGFTDRNFEAFSTADTTFKAARGGKGVGRFLWLVAFDQVEIKSIYREDIVTQCRQFSFLAEDDGIKNMAVTATDASTTKTSVKLLGYNARYQKACPKRLDTIASHIIEHCLEFFLSSSCPVIILKEDSSTESINLNLHFNKEMVSNTTSDEFLVKGEIFYVNHVRLHHTHTTDHLAHYCAHDRAVTATKLSGRIPNLSRVLEAEDGRRFYYACYVEGDFLDASVNTERTAFNIQPDIASGELFPSNEINWNDITTATEKLVRQYLQPYTDPIKIKKAQRINKYLATDGPMYRPIMKYVDAKIELIDPDIDDETLDVKLYEAYHDLQVELKKEGKELLASESDLGVGLDEYKQRLESYFDKITDINMADLARYVCHRRAVLDFLHKQLTKREDSSYPMEDRVHSIIFPMGATSDEVLLDGHNLWIIDEKLAYHAFLASDKQLRTLPPVNTPSQKEPDIIVFETACAFVASTDPPYPAVVIVEFKKAMRNDYSMKKNPFVQVREYITEIQSGSARTPEGRDIPIGKDIPFYCYIVCDMSPTLDKWAMDFELQKTPDQQGYFGFKRHYNAYFEVISYTKMISDAKKRNAVLFHKLGLDSRTRA